MGLLKLIFIKSNICSITWLLSSYVLNCEKKIRRIAQEQPATNGKKKNVLCVCFVSGAEL